MDSEALEHSLVRRLLDHIEHGTTDLADAVLEVPADTYTSRVRTSRTRSRCSSTTTPLVLCLSGALPRPGSYRTVDLCGTPDPPDPGPGGHGAGDGQRVPAPRRSRGRRRGRGEALHLSVPRVDLRHRGTAGRPPGRRARSRGCAGRTKGWWSCRSPKATDWSSAGCGPGRRRHRRSFSAPGSPTSSAMLDFADWEPYGEPHVHSVERQLEGHARHLPGELPLRPPAPDDAGGLRVRRGA